MVCEKAEGIHADYPDNGWQEISVVRFYVCDDVGATEWIRGQPRFPSRHRFARNDSRSRSRQSANSAVRKKNEPRAIYFKYNRPIRRVRFVLGIKRAALGRGAKRRGTRRHPRTTGPAIRTMLPSKHVCNSNIMDYGVLPSFPPFLPSFPAVYTSV